MVEGKKTKIVFLVLSAILFGLYSLVYFFFKEGDAVGGVMMLVGAVVLGVPAGLLLAFAICPIIGDMVGGSIFYPTSTLKAPPKLIAPIRGMINQGKTENAEQELLGILLEHPRDPIPVQMLADIYMDELQEYESAESMMKKFLEYKKLKPSDEVLDILMRYADCCEALADPLRAQPFFEQELTKKYSEPSLKAIQRRLNAMKADG